MIWLVVRDITNTKSTSTQPPSFDKILQFASYLEMKKKKKEKEAADLSGNSGIKKLKKGQRTLMMLRLWKKPLLYVVDDILEIFFKSIRS